MPHRNDRLRRRATSKTEQTTATDATEIDEIVVMGVAKPHRLFKIIVAPSNRGQPVR